jgi:hypothetical protein
MWVKPGTTSLVRAGYKRPLPRVAADGMTRQAEGPVPEPALS